MDSCEHACGGWSVSRTVTAPPWQTGTERTLRGTRAAARHADIGGDQGPAQERGQAAVLATILVLGTYVLVSYAIQAFAGFGTTGIGLNNP